MNRRDANNLYLAVLGQRPVSHKRMSLLPPLSTAHRASTPMLPTTPMLIRTPTSSVPPTPTGSKQGHEQNKIMPGQRLRVSSLAPTANHMPMPSTTNVARRSTMLPARPETERVLLMINLIGTLMHVDEVPKIKYTSRTADFSIPMDLDGIEGVTTYVYLRPHAAAFVRQMKELFDVGVFTSSPQIVTDALLEGFVSVAGQDVAIDPANRRCLEHCTRLVARDGELEDSDSTTRLLKDVTLLGYPTARVLLLDDDRSVGAAHPRNLLVVPTYDLQDSGAWTTCPVLGLDGVPILLRGMCSVAEVHDTTLKDLAAGPLAHVARGTNVASDMDLWRHMSRARTGTARNRLSVRGTAETLCRHNAGGLGVRKLSQPKPI
eukprot:PhM_4_TR415/c0_g1_i1/m.23482/K15731/CTDSP; carboxy-terminal domain RNA polymerase II polypeptide A small phosphatase